MIKEFNNLIKNNNAEHFGSFEVLQIYFNSKPIEIQHQILIDSSFGC